MDLIPNTIRPQLKANFDDESLDHFPLVKLFCRAINRGPASAEVDRQLYWTSPFRVREDAG